MVSPGELKSEWRLSLHYETYQADHISVLIYL